MSNSGIMLEPDVPETRKALNDLARHQLIVRILQEIEFDLMICEIEGWDKRKFIRQIQSAVDKITKKISSGIMA